jgi:hypothetical protein
MDRVGVRGLAYFRVGKAALGALEVPESDKSQSFERRHHQYLQAHPTGPDRFLSSESGVLDAVVAPAISIGPAPAVRATCAVAWRTGLRTIARPFPPPCQRRAAAFVAFKAWLLQVEASML